MQFSQDQNSAAQGSTQTGKVEIKFQFWKTQEFGKNVQISGKIGEFDKRCNIKSWNFTSGIATRLLHFTRLNYMYLNNERKQLFILIILLWDLNILQ